MDRANKEDILHYFTSLLPKSTSLDNIIKIVKILFIEKNTMSSLKVLETCKKIKSVMNSVSSALDKYSASKLLSRIEPEIASLILGKEEKQEISALETSHAIIEEEMLFMKSFDTEIKKIKEITKERDFFIQTNHKLTEEGERLLKKFEKSFGIKQEKLTQEIDEIVSEINKNKEKIDFYQEKTRDDEEKQEEKIYTAVRDEILKNSPISEEMAKQWVEENTFLHKSVLSTLKKSHYSLEQFNADCAEYYRLVGGKLGHVIFDSKAGLKRSYAYGKSYVFAQGSSFNKRTLFHELSHLLETTDSAAIDCCHDYAQDRGKGKIIKLKSVNKNYSNDEVAYDAHFLNAYTGKLYTDEYNNVFATEVTSTGIETFADPQKLTNLLLNDPKHFALSLGLMRNKGSFAEKEDGKELIKHNKQFNSLWKKELEKNALNALERFLSYKNNPHAKYYIEKKSARTYCLIEKAKEENNILYQIFKGTKKEVAIAMYLCILLEQNILEDIYKQNKHERRKRIHSIEYYAKNAPLWFTGELSFQNISY